MELTFVTSNRAKWLEAKEILGAWGIDLKLGKYPMWEPDHGSVDEIANEKLKQVIELEENVMVDDAGIFFEAYPMFPGVLSKRVFQLLGYKGIQKLLVNESRKAWFEGAIAVSFQGQQNTFIGRTVGTIGHFDPDLLSDFLDHPYPYDPIFIPEGKETVLEELDHEQKLACSYRRKALVQMAEWILRSDKR
ncbi:non-canonical purine NTP pyrophosphatase [Risungbinella massiliensis]|uniref:non-canonical purine NTP pyrophosphatase n=1 Tax=Risungbinella massiliensis TaxID=1329796 RepID=UPI0005CBDCA8|nr:non-canonical purine NTP pyrophosphatase [Risungbinella massiliensis]